MKKEEFIFLGITEELAVKAEKASVKELEGYVTKEQLEAANASKTGLEKDIKTRDKQLEDIKKSSGDNETLKTQIETLQADNKTAKEKYDSDMKELRLSTAVKLAVAGSAQDVDIVAGLVDKGKLLLSEDGKVTGLEEQIKAMKETKSFLFKPEPSGAAAGKPGTKPDKGTGYTPKAGEASEGGWAKTVAERLNKEGGTNSYAGAWDTK